MGLTLSDYAAMAEVLGLVALVPSLIFVGVQLRRGYRARAAADLRSGTTNN